MKSMQEKENVEEKLKIGWSFERNSFYYNDSYCPKNRPWQRIV